MKDVVAISIEREQLKAVDSHPLRKDIGRSGLYRVAMSEFLERRGSKELENESNNESSKEE